MLIFLRNIHLSLLMGGKLCSSGEGEGRTDGKDLPEHVRMICDFGCVVVLLRYHVALLLTDPQA